MYILRISLKSFTKINKFNKTLLKIKKLKLFKKIRIQRKFFNIKTKNKIFTVLKSPHVNKKSREQFHLKNYNQKIDIYLKNVFRLLNFLIILKKIVNINYLIKIKIIKQ
jgi:small subunit ribosomal protein S10